MTLDCDKYEGIPVYFAGIPWRLGNRLEIELHILDLKRLLETSDETLLSARKMGPKELRLIRQKLEEFSERATERNLDLLRGLEDCSFCTLDVPLITDCLLEEWFSNLDSLWREILNRKYCFEKNRSPEVEIPNQLKIHGHPYRTLKNQAGAILSHLLIENEFLPGVAVIQKLPGAIVREAGGMVEDGALREKLRSHFNISTFYVDGIVELLLSPASICFFSHILWMSNLGVWVSSEVLERLPY